MKRAITTAKPLCDILGLTMQMRDGLREISYGEWEDREAEDVRLHHEQDYIRWQTNQATIRIILCSLLGIDVGRYPESHQCPCRLN